MINTRPTKTSEFGKTASDYAAHRAGFPPSFFEALAARRITTPGQDVVDLGTGAGTIARGLAARKAKVIGVDIDPKMLKEAQNLALSEGLDISFQKASADATGLTSASADLVIAGQCWHWFDYEKAPLEAARLLKPGGLFVIAYFDWLPLKGNVVEATERLILKFNPKWRGANGLGMHPIWLRQLPRGRV